MLDFDNTIGKQEDCFATIMSNGWSS